MIKSSICLAMLAAAATVAVAIGSQRQIIITDEEKVSIRQQVQAMLSSHNSLSTDARQLSEPPEGEDGCYMNFDYRFSSDQIDWINLEFTGDWFNDESDNSILNLRSNANTSSSSVGTKESFYNADNVMGLRASMRPAGNTGKMSYFTLREPWAANCSDPNSCHADQVDWEFPGAHINVNYKIDNVVYNAKDGQTSYQTITLYVNPEAAIADYWIFLQNGRYLAFTCYLNGEQHINEIWADQYYVPTKPMAAYVGIWDCNNNNDYCGETLYPQSWTSVQRLSGQTCQAK